MKLSVPANVELDRLIRPCLIVAAVSAFLGLFGWIFEADAFYRAYLWSWVLWTSLSLGALATVKLHNLTGGEFGWMIRRLGENAAMVLPVMLVLSIPMLIGIHHLYPWAQPDKLKSDAVLRHRRAYLNGGFFTLRLVIYFTTWIATAWFLRSRSLRFDRYPTAETEKAMHDVSAVMMLVYFITMSFASVDWIMSREPHWYSTIFGWQVICGQAVGGLSLLIVALCLMAEREPFKDYLKADYFNDLGTLLLTCVILWSYMTFVQFLISWMGDKQDEIPWYTQRMNNGWFALAVLLVIFHFFVPYITLLMRAAKRKREIMFWLCVSLLLMRAVEYYWMVGPSGDDRLPKLHRLISWMDFVFPVGMGALWVAVFGWLGQRHPLMAEGYTVPLAEPVRPEELGTASY